MKKNKNKNKIVYAISILTLAIFIAIGELFVYAEDSTQVQPGSNEDPFVTLSYINEKFKTLIKQKSSEILDQTFSKIQDNGYKKIDEINQKAEEQADGYNIIAQSVQSSMLNLNLLENTTQQYYDIRLHDKDIVWLGLGAKVILKDGSAAFYGEEQEYIDVLNGSDIDVKQKIKPSTQYLKSNEADGGVQALQNYTTVSVCGTYKIDKTYVEQYGICGDALNQLGLFKGTEHGYELDKSASRIEALVMLIRLLGEEEKALNCTYKNPFNDVDLWADRYVAYAYEKGYTKGTSAEKFTPSALTTSDQYMTFVLRALGYSDTNGDFAWNNAVNYGIEKNVIKQADTEIVNNGVFRRDYMVYLSVKALNANKKSRNISLAESLISNGVINSKKYEKIKSTLKKFK